MSEKFSLRQPDYLDLSHDFWKLQPRDLFGRWTSGGGEGVPKPPKKTFDSQFERVERSRTQTVTKNGKTLFHSESRHSKTHAEARELDRGEIRQSLSLDHESRDMLYESAGLKGEFHESETELLHKWHETTDPKEKERLQHEMMVRQKCLSVALSTVQEAQTLAKREEKRNAVRVFDDHLKKSKIGQALLKIRDRLVSDKAFDTAEKAAEGAKEYGKDWVKHLATSRLTGMLVAASVGLSAHFLGGDMPEALRQFMENPVAEAGAAAAVGLAIGLAAKMLRRGAKKAEKKAPLVKQKLKGA